MVKKRKKKYFVVFNVPMAIGNGDNGYQVKAINKLTAKNIAFKQCLKCYKPRFLYIEELS